MTIKLMPLDKAFPGAFNTNKERSSLLVHAGVDWLQLYHLVAAGRKEHCFLLTVELPVMHQCLELLIKALATWIDPVKTPKQMGHETIKIVDAYQAQIPAFATIANDKVKRELVEELEGAYFSVRYFETTIQYNGADAKLFEEVALALVEEYHSLTKIPLLRHHFKNTADKAQAPAAPLV